MKKIVAALAVAICAWIAWPYWSLYSLIAAVRDADIVGLEASVDWNSVRAGLRDDLKAALMAKMAKETQGAEDNGLQMGIAMMLGPMIVDKAIDSYVTPQGLISLLKAQAPQNNQAAAGTNAGTSSTSAVTSEPAHQPRLTWDQIRYAFFTGPTSFRIDVSGKQGTDFQDQIITLLFRWDGSWKLTRVLVPPELLESAKG